MFKLAIVVVLCAAVAVPSALVLTQGQGTDTRIVAYIHENGSVEFGLQLKEGDEWGGIIQPRARFLSPDAPRGRWLSSSEMNIVYRAAPVQPGIDLVLPVEVWSEGQRQRIAPHVEFYAQPDSRGSWRSWLKVRTDGASVEFGCYQNLRSRTREQYTYWGELNISGKVDWSRGITIIARGADEDALWRPEFNRHVDRDTFFSPVYLEILSHYAQLTLIVHDQYKAGETVTLNFSTANAFNTPVQSNLEYCGRY